MHRQTHRVKTGLMTELESDEEIVRGKTHFGLQKMQSSNDQHIYCQS